MKLLDLRKKLACSNATIGLPMERSDLRKKFHGAQVPTNFFLKFLVCYNLIVQKLSFTLKLNF